MFESLDNIVFDIKKDKYTKYEKNGSYLKKISKCPSNRSTGILHNKFMTIKKKKKVDKFIEEENHKLK